MRTVAVLELELVCVMHVDTNIVPCVHTDSTVEQHLLVLGPLLRIARRRLALLLEHAFPAVVASPCSAIVPGRF